MNKGNVQKTPLGPSLVRIAQQTVASELQKQGKALPCTVVKVTGSIVTVKFEVTATQTLPQITIPMLGSQWLRVPVQVGDQGFTVPCDVFLGGVSGLGGGVASTVVMGNLTALAFSHVSQTTWPATPNPNAAWINGPDGVVLSDTGKTTFLKVTPGEVAIIAGGKTWTFNATGFTLSNGVVDETHQHLYSPGGGTPTLTGEPVA